jgi:riboflavin transporter FmnP
MKLARAEPGCFNYVRKKRGINMIASMRKWGYLRTSTMVKIGMLGGMGLILFLLDFPLPIFPSFLKLDFSDTPALVGTFHLGPAAGVAIQLLKNLLNLIVRNQTGGVEELANFLIGTAFVVPLGLVYKKKPNYTGVIVGCILSVLTMTAAAVFLNYYVFILAFAFLMGFEIEDIVRMAAAINLAIVDLRTMVAYAIVPFNLVKGVLVSFVGFGLFKALQPLWKLR